MRRQILVCLLGAIGAVLSQCPHEDPALVSWTDSNAWENGKVPQDNEDGKIIGNVLLDSQPAVLHHLTIAPGAKLVFNPATNVHLKVHAIYVEGELHIGHKDCLFEGQAHVTFLGDVGDDKILLVKEGGTLEIHGERKLPWTKLAQTAQKLENSGGIKEVRDLMELCNDNCRNGLILYEIDPTTGEVEKANLFDFIVTAPEIENRIKQFVQALIDIPNGKIVGLALKKNIISSMHNFDLTPVFDAIDILAHDGNKQSPIRQADAGSAYAMLTIKGNPSSTVEDFEANTGSLHTITVKAYIDDHAFVLDSTVTNKGAGCSSFVEFHVYLDEFYRPTITLLDHVNTWKVGDKLIMASTDYNPRQAEEVTILEIKEPNQVRLSGPLRYTHYGEMNKGIDMRGEVGLLTRNIKFDSEDAATSDTYGGHIKVLANFTSVHIEGAELEDLGQQEVTGAYSIHFHMCEDVDTMASRPWIRENSIHHSNSRCVTIHATHGLIVQDNVCYKTIGHSYFLEDGGEQRNILEHNLGLGTEKPPKDKGIIPTDHSCPTTFWVTNPKNYYRHNAAAGSDCRGYWFNYPDVPTGPSATKGYMLNREARFTAIYEFLNNVAHSCKGAGLFVDNILRPDGKSNGYNKYRPMKDPVTNNCMNNPSNCEDDCVYLRKYTGYKNARQNAWIRGGCIKLVESSMTDSETSVALLRDNPAYQFVERSIIMGDSINAGEPEDFLSFNNSLQRSFPFGWSEKQRKNIHLGVKIIKGPIYVTDVWFDSFKDTEDYYPMGAFGFRRRGGAKSSPRTTITNAKFGFNDMIDGNRVRDYHPDDERYTEADGDDINSFRDGTGSVTGATCSDPSVTAMVVRPLKFHMTNQCHLRPNWNMAWCCHNFGEIMVRDTAAIDDDDIVTMVRDDIPDEEMDSNFGGNAPFLVILGGQYSYTMFHDSTLPEQIMIRTVGVTNTNYVRLGVCLPPNAEFNLKIFHPTSFNSIDKWTRVSSLAELDGDLAGGKYFYHEESGYFATVLRNKNDFLLDEHHENPRNKAVALFINITKGDRTQTRCLPAARAALGDLSPQQTRKRKLISILRQLLSEPSTIGENDDRQLLQDAVEPPQEWGARSSHVPWPTTPHVPIARRSS